MRPNDTPHVSVPHENTGLTGRTQAFFRQLVAKVSGSSETGEQRAHKACTKRLETVMYGPKRPPGCDFGGPPAIQAPAQARSALSCQGSGAKIGRRCFASSSAPSIGIPSSLARSAMATVAERSRPPRQ